MGAGSYKHRLIVQKRTETASATSIGEPVASWSQYAIRWAKREPLSGSERVGNDVTQSTLSDQWRLHKTEGIAPKMRILAPLAHTTLATGLTTTTGTSVKVASASGFPLEGKYRIRVGSELMQVTAGQNTTTWTVTRGVDGTTAATATQGTSVAHMQVHDIEAAWVEEGRGSGGTESVIQTRVSDAIG